MYTSFSRLLPVVMRDRGETSGSGRAVRDVNTEGLVRTKRGSKVHWGRVWRSGGVESRPRRQERYE